MSRDLVKLVEELKVVLMRKSPLLSFMLGALKVEYSEEENPAIVRVRGDRLIVHKNALFDQKAFAFAMIRAILHGAMAHPYRIVRLKRRYGTGIKKLDKGVVELARMASDIVLLRLMPKRFKKVAEEVFNASERYLDEFLGEDWQTLSVEQVFERLLEMSDKVFITLSGFWNGNNAKSQQIDVEGTEKVLEGAGKNSSASQEIDEKIEKMMKQMGELLSRLHALGAGHNESDLIRKLIEEYLKEKPLPWNQILKNFIDGWYKKHWVSTWEKPHRKHDDLPGYKEIARPRVIVAVDVSGSISDKEYAVFCREVWGIVKNFAEVHLVAWDVQADYYGAIKNFDELLKIAKKVRGYGGTHLKSIVPVLMKKLKPKVGRGDLLILMTDGAFAEDDEEVRKVLKELRCSKVLLTAGKKHEGFDLVLKLGGEQN